MNRATLLLLALPVAACHAPTSNITITSDQGEGNISIQTDATGQTAIKVPGVDVKVQLPKIHIDEKDFEVNGVRLYPGSTITDFNLSAENRTTEKDKGRVTIQFDSPAPLDKVQAWFRDNMAQRGFRMTARGSGFTGTSGDGDPVALELNADGADKSKGRMTVGG